MANSSTAKTNLRVVTETDERQGAEAEARYEEVVSTSSVDRRLLHGPFASNIWGGRYEIDGFGGQGSQGVTFTGVDRKTGARVAVKLFDLGRAKDWKAQELFDREVRTLQKLSHPGVPRFMDVIVDDETGARALVMTHIAGESLGAMLSREKQMAEKRLWALLVDAAHVLAAVHGEGIVHRDLKPENFILKPDGTVALVDFGGVGGNRARAGSTVVGTFGYMAPEQLYGAQTAATDLYALGATVLTMATGIAPEDQPREGLAVDVDEAAPFLSDPLRGLLKKLLAPDPKARPRDAAALLVELKTISQQKTQTSSKKPDQVLNKNSRQDGSVDAIWHEDAEDAMKAAEGGLGLIAALVGMFATIGLGRVLLPMILTLIAAFSSPEQQRKIHLLRDLVERKAKLLQEQMKQSGIRSAQQLEELNAKDKDRRGKKQRKHDKKMEKLERESARLDQEMDKRRNQAWWK